MGDGSFSGWRWTASCSAAYCKLGTSSVSMGSIPLDGQYFVAKSYAKYINLSSSPNHALIFPYRYDVSANETAPFNVQCCTALAMAWRKTGQVTTRWARPRRVGALQERRAKGGLQASAEVTVKGLVPVVRDACPAGRLFPFQPRRCQRRHRRRGRPRGGHLDWAVAGARGAPLPRPSPPPRHPPGRSGPRRRRPPPPPPSPTLGQPRRGGGAAGSAPHR